MKPLRRFWDLVASGELQLVAGALSFSTLLSLIPFLAVSLATLQYINGLEKIYPKVEAVALQYFQGPTGSEGTQVIHKVFRRVHTGRMGSWGAVALVLTSILLVNDMERGLHRIWDLPKRRPLYQRIFYCSLALFLFPAGLAAYVALGSLKVFDGSNALISMKAVDTLILFFALFFVYKVVPNTRVSVGAASVGALGATAGLMVLVRWFKWLSQSFFSWGKLYGGLAAIPALLLWVMLVWYVILIGAALSASFRK